MLFLRAPEPFRIIFWATAIGATVGAAYAQMRVIQSGAPAFPLYGVPRGVFTGALIAGLLTSLEAILLAGSLGAMFRRAPFPVHVAIKTLIYLAVILAGLELGGRLFPSPGESGIQGADVLFCLPLRSCSSSCST